MLFAAFEDASRRALRGQDAARSRCPRRRSTATAEPDRPPPPAPPDRQRRRGSHAAAAPRPTNSSADPRRRSFADMARSGARSRSHAVAPWSQYRRWLGAMASGRTDDQLGTAAVRGPRRRRIRQPGQPVPVTDVDHRFGDRFGRASFRNIDVTDPSCWFMVHTPPAPTVRNRGKRPTSIVVIFVGSSGSLRSSDRPARPSPTAHQAAAHGSGTHRQRPTPGDLHRPAVHRDQLVIGGKRNVTGTTGRS